MTAWTSFLLPWDFEAKNNLSLCLNNCTTVEWEQFVNSILLFWEHIKWLWKGKWAPNKFLLTVLIDLSDMNPTSVFPMTKSHLLLYQGRKFYWKSLWWHADHISCFLMLQTKSRWIEWETGRQSKFRCHAFWQTDAQRYPVWCEGTRWGPSSPFIKENVE